MDDTLKALGIDLKGLRYEDLNAAEKATLDTWLKDLSRNELTVDKIREYVHQMKDAIEFDFTKPDLPAKQDIFLKARLRNIMLLESFLLSPERAKKALQQAIKGVGK